MWRVAVALVLVLSFSLVAAVPVAASPDVSDVRVELGAYGESAALVDYHIYFTPGADLEANVDTISILFPVDTGNIANVVFGDVSVDADADAVGVGPVVLPAAGYLAKAGYRIELTTPVDLTAGVEARVDILARLTNPTTAGTTYKVELWTSQETTHVDSSSYTIYLTPARQLTVVDFTTTPLSDAHVGTLAIYTVDITAVTGLAANWDTISIVFPEGTGLPASIAANNVTVDGANLGEAPIISGRTVTLKSPVIFGVMAYNDADANGYDAGDHVYWDADGTATVTVDDIRISNPPVGVVGSQVAAADADVGNALPGLGGAMAYEDLGAGGYDAGDQVLWDADADGTISLNDVRLSNPLGGTAVGDQVAAGDGDGGNALAAFPAGAAMAYEDVDASTTYNVGDQVLWDADGSGDITLNDIRLSNPLGGTAVGDQVAAGDADAGVLAAVGGAMMYNDADANGYDAGDPVYWVVTGATPTAVDDIRISNPPVGVVGSQVAGADADAGSAVVAVGGAMMYNDADASGTYNVGDPVYWVVAGATPVAVDDIKIANPNAGNPGDQVAAGDGDAGLAVLALGGALAYFDLDGSTTYNAGDEVYWDADGSGTVTVDDIRISNPPAGAVGSQVVAGDADLPSALVALPDPAATIVVGSATAVITNPILANDAAPNSNNLINTGHYVGKAYTSKDTGVIWDTTFPGAEIRFDPASASGIAFNPLSAGAHSVPAGDASGNIDIWTVDLYGNRSSLPGGVTIDVSLASSSTTGTFYDTADGDNTFNDDEATIVAGGNIATFRYKDSAVGSYTITASYGSWSPVDWAMEVLGALKAELYDGDVLVGTYDNITAAINNALATNTIKVYPGTYREGALPALARADLTLESTEGAASTIIDARAGGADALTVTNDGVTISGFTIQNSLANAGDCLVNLNYLANEVATKTVTIQDCILDLTTTTADVADDGVVITPVNLDGINIQNCDFIVEGTDDAVFTVAGGTTDVTIDTCTFTGSSGYGYVDANGIGTTLSNCTFDGLDMGLDLDNAGCDVMVDSCTFINASATTPAVGAIDVGTAAIAAPASLVIQGSTFQDNAGYSINVAAAAASNRIWVKFNSFLNNAEGMNCGGVPALNALHNYWGDASGPSGVGAGTGDAISANVDYDPWFRAPVSAGAFADAANSLNAQAAVGVTITGAAAADLAVARYSENPVETPEFTPIENGFFDAYVSAVGAATQVGIKFYDAAITSDSVAYMWDAFEETWKPCTEQSSVAGMTWVKARPYDADHPRVPTIEDLSGTVFAIGSALVEVDLESIDATPDEVSLAVDGTQALTVTATYSDESTADVTAASTYVSSNTAVATVSPAGVITGEGEGSATITVTYIEDGIEATDTVSVTVSVFDPWIYDADEDGVMEIDEVLTAISDYFATNITITEVLEVIALYF